MTARQPRRTRRRNVPSESLPRLRPGEGSGSATPVVSSTRPNQRVHHVTEDYSYVRKDMVLVAAFSVLTFAFIVAMSFIV
jgi:hypothetical protein